MWAMMVNNVKSKIQVYPFQGYMSPDMYQRVQQHWHSMVSISISNRLWRDLRCRAFTIALGCLDRLLVMEAKASTLYTIILCIRRTHAFKTMWSRAVCPRWLSAAACTTWIYSLERHLEHVRRRDTQGWDADMRRIVPAEHLPLNNA